MQRYTATDADLWLWLALGVLAAVLLGTMIVTVLKVKERPGTGGFKLPPLSTIYKSFKINTKAQPNFIPFLISRLLFLTPLILVRTYGLYYLQDVAGIPEPEAVATVGNLIIVVIVVAAAVVYPAGRLADKIGKRKVTVASGFIGAVGVVPLFFSQSYTAVMLAGGILGLSYGAFTSANWAMATDLVVKDEEARYLGLTNLASAGSTALVGLLGLVIYLLEVDLPGLGYLAMLAASLIFFIVSSIILLRLKVR
jgi:Na+/melibiose symporter-like transporter